VVIVGEREREEDGGGRAAVVATASPRMDEDMVESSRFAILGRRSIDIGRKGSRGRLSETKGVSDTRLRSIGRREGEGERGRAPWEGGSGSGLKRVIGYLLLVVVPAL